MKIVMQYVRRYFADFRRHNILWKAGVFCAVIGLVWLLAGIWLTPSVAINSPAATQQRNAAVALIAIGMILRFAGQVLRVRQSYIQRKRR